MREYLSLAVANLYKKMAAFVATIGPIIAATIATGRTAVITAIITSLMTAGITGVITGLAVAVMVETETLRSRWSV